MSFLDTIDELERGEEEGVMKVARESISTETEKEYCLWVKPTEEGWNWLREQQGSMYVDTLMPINRGKRRVRLTEDHKAVLTVKRFADDGCVEENSDIGFDTALTFYQDDFVSHLVKRIHLPAGELEAKGGKHWDIDVFYRAGGHPQLLNTDDYDALLNTMKQGSSYGEWVKVELEVDRFEMESIREHIPFAVEDVIPSRPTKPEDQEFIRNYWDVDTRL